MRGGKRLRQRREGIGMMPTGSARPRQREPYPAETNQPHVETEGMWRATGVSRLPLVLGAATGILLCALALAVLFVVNSHAASPDATGQTLCADVGAQNYDAVYELLAPPLQNLGSATQFGASQRELDALSGKVTSCAVTVLSADSTQASLRLTITRQRTGASQAAVHLQLLSGAWKVDAYDTSLV